MSGTCHVRQVTAIKLHRGRVVPTRHATAHVQHLSLGQLGTGIRAVDDVVVGGVLLGDGQHGDHGGPGGGKQHQVIGIDDGADVGPSQVAPDAEVAR